MMPVRDALWRIKITLLSQWNRLKNSPSSFFSIKSKLRALKGLNIGLSVKSFPSFVKSFPLSLREWTLSTGVGRMRAFVLLVALAVLFFFVTIGGYFIANDAFVSFRYVSNAVRGFGFVWNPPPFRPVSGYGSFLWLILLRGFWFLGIEPPLSADIMTFAFSFGTVIIGFFFLRRTKIHPAFESKSLLLYFAYVLFLLTNKTFLGFFWSGTETAMFGFLVLLWCYLITEKDRNPFLTASVAAVLALTHWEGFVFIPFTLLTMFFPVRGNVKKIIGGLAVLTLPFFYLKWLAARYGVFPSVYFSSFFNGFFPSFNTVYFGSFAVEYALYYWIPFAAVWLLFQKLVLKRKILPLVFLPLVFAVYVGVYTAVRGAEELEYKPFVFLLPLTFLGGLHVLTNRFTKRLRTVLLILAGYILLSGVIPFIHETQTKGLETRKETAYLYKPIPEKALRFALFGEYWNRAQRTLIYQGAGLRLKEHRVFFKGLSESLPARKDGEKIKPEHRRITSWNYAGQIGWIFPNAFIIDTSGQNDFYISTLPVKSPNGRRLLGREKEVPLGYLTCFAGGNNLRFVPFGGKPAVAMTADMSLTDGLIKGCENFWRAQIKRDDNAVKLIDPSKK